MDVLSGVSPDYAVVAQKDADDHILMQTSAAFAKDYGVTMEQLVANYQRVINASWLKTKLGQLRAVFGLSY